MQFSVRILFIAIAISALLVAGLSFWFRPYKIELGMTSENVSSVMIRAGGTNVSDPELDVISPDGNGRQIWSISESDLVVGTVYRDNILTEIVAWDWSGKEFNWADYFTGAQFLKAIKIWKDHGVVEQHLAEP